MASYTVLQLKNFVAGLPAGANSLLIEVPDGLALPVVDPATRRVDPDGTLWYTVRGYFNLDTHTWTAVP